MAKKSRKPAQKEEEFDNEGRGVLFKNKRKKKESQPDMTGQIEIDGKEYWLSAWYNESKRGMKFIALAATEKEEEEEEEEDEDNDNENFIPKKKGKAKAKPKRKPAKEDDEDEDDDGLPF